jgi:lactoylglutathione lyase
MRTLHTGIRVSDIERTLSFYGALGYRVVGAVPGTELGDLTMIALPGDPFVALELVHAAGRQIAVEGISHLVIQVESLSVVAESLAVQGIDIDGPTVHDPETGFATAWITDPDGYRIELVQWPPGHPEGMTNADFETGSTRHP